MDKLKWCLKQKRGIELIEPNKNLADVYLEKSQNSLASMREVKAREWKITTAYYTIYFSIYAIMMKIGIKSEIHSCTIEFTKIFLNDYFDEMDLKLFNDAFIARKNMQYYVNKEIDDLNFNNIISNAQNFLIKSKDIINKINEVKINSIRNELMR
ncbi:hypothetical protein HOD20_06490 [archaeon]|jgi:uncharacterized protein (UPF0332 family)|nr:hypothetical protein [archaeon]MBT4352151.1 hypothetical protein [archaeon]MBT4648285.1 hypothetical protein [archaeon]MBT6821537.1 hypothetical protein [archaeon]MBT7391936.1 hypothetical protein [archaeon]